VHPNAGDPYGEGDPRTAPNRQIGSALAELDEADAAAGRAGARFTTPAVGGGPTVLEPAVAGRRGPDDDEHATRYVQESDEMFGDDRLVTPPVLGAAAEPEREPVRRPEPRRSDDELSFGTDALRGPDSTTERD
jgi:hypothetical protein